MARPGAAPGKAEYTGEPRNSPIHIDLVEFTPTTVRALDDVSAEQARRSLEGSSSISWVDIDGIHDVQVVQRIGELWGIHPLSIEDVMEPEGRPKAEYYEDYIYVVLRMVTHSKEDGLLDTEQVSLFLGRDFVLTFQEQDGDVFGGVRKRLRDSKARVRRHGADFLAYSLLDAVVDDYFGVLETLEEQVDALDSLKPKELPADTPERLHSIKRQLRRLRQSLRPLREAVAALTRSPDGWIDPQTQPYLRDLSDNLAEEVETIDILRETCQSLLDLYNATVSNRTNDEMRVLTVIATIFIPLTFITGLYGMNFDYMPELHSRYGYYIALGLMVATSGGLLAYFRYKKWL
ncbi:MAG: magnesium/cobalt transporter CorA [Myxococcota bacterium]|nr:magnesium/cobalt transporter CorA [Myxococcota bacterium]